MCVRFFVAVRVVRVCRIVRCTHQCLSVYNIRTRAAGASETNTYIYYTYVLVSLAPAARVPGNVSELVGACFLVGENISVKLHF